MRHVCIAAAGTRQRPHSEVRGRDGKSAQIRLAAKNDRERIRKDICAFTMAQQVKTPVVVQVLNN